jgi:hypothetical protein
MVFSKDWLKNLLINHDGVNIPCSRLVESGKLLSGLHAISKNFGRNPQETINNKKEWLLYADSIKINECKKYGLYMPCIFEKDTFIKSGMYPEGNIYNDGIGTRNGDVIQSGDDYYFRNIMEEKYGMNHITVFDSIVYHIQEGEMND